MMLKDAPEVEAASAIADRPYRVAAVVSHPIQYQVPMFRHMVRGGRIDLSVIYCSDENLRPSKSRDFGTTFQWDIPLLEGYKSEILTNVGKGGPESLKFWGVSTPAMAERIRSGGYDAIWVHGWGFHSYWQAMRAAWRAGVPVMIRGEANLIHPARGPKGWIKEQVLRRLFRKVSAFLVIGRRNREFYTSFGVPEERCFLVPYSVDNDHFRSEYHRLLPRRDELRARLGISPEATVFGLCGKLIDPKRPLDLLEAYRPLEAERDVALVLIGSGPLQGEIERKITEYGLKNVHITGFINQSALPEYYTILDVMVSCSWREQWGLVNNEAMNFDLPLVVSDHVGSGIDLVQPGQNGYFFPAGDVESLRSQMRRLAAAPELRREMGRRSGERVTGWSYAACERGLLAALSAVCGKQG